MTNLSVADMIRAGQFTQAVEQMRALSRLADPTEPVDVEAVRAAFEARRSHLRSVVQPAPFRIVVEIVP